MLRVIVRHTNVMVGAKLAFDVLEATPNAVTTVLAKRANPEKAAEMQAYMKTDVRPSRLVT